MIERNHFCPKCEGGGPRRYVCVSCCGLGKAGEYLSIMSLRCLICKRDYHPEDIVIMCLNCANGFFKQAEAV